MDIMLFKGKDRKNICIETAEIKCIYIWHNIYKMISFYK